MWYDAMKPYIKSGQLVMLGVIQEQHADRCQLFKQWQELNFPVVQDLLNTNGIDVVPLYVAIDEHGIVRGTPRSSRNFDLEFIEADFPKPNTTAPVLDSKTATVAFWEAQVAKQPGLASWLGLGDALLQWKPDQEGVMTAIQAYTQALESAPTRSDIMFRMGAANRMLYELKDQADSALFAQAVRHWESALDMNPNQYIYRRRIEQYGPRLKKPYSFYDWVTTARADIVARDGVPHPLAVEPNGAEFAERTPGMTVDRSAKNPDPENRILQDYRNFVLVHSNFVPTHPKPGEVVAVHVGFSVSESAKWNHETEPLTLWIDQPEGDIKLSAQLITDPRPHAQAESQDPVSISFEVQIPENQVGALQLEGFALFNICETERGQCIYRRKNVKIEIPVR